LYPDPTPDAAVRELVGVDAAVMLEPTGTYGQYRQSLDVPVDPAKTLSRAGG
jgi:hypothetical protein